MAGRLAPKNRTDSYEDLGISRGYMKESRGGSVMWWLESYKSCLDVSATKDAFNLQ